MCESISFKLTEFTWKIENFSQKKLKNGPGKQICSQSFPADSESDLKFTLQFYPQGWVKSGDTEVPNGEICASLYLKAECSKKYDTSYHVEFSILDADGEKFGIRHCLRHQTIPFLAGSQKTVLLTDLENPANNLLPNDTLTICCRVKETKSKTEECNCLFEHSHTTRARRKLAEDLATLKDKKFADFVFKVNNEKIAAHKNILAARSSVFAAMFQHNMQENRINETEVTDVTPAAFKQLLRFIYTGYCEVGLLAEELLVAANKYDIPDLKDICAKELRRNLTADNAVHHLILSDLDQAEDLKDGAIRFINKNAPAVMKTPSWSNFHKSHPDLIYELYSKLFD
jgi:speckle-type POZ protein